QRTPPEPPPAMTRTTQAKPLSLRSRLVAALTALTAGVGGCAGSTAVSSPSNAPDAELTQATTAPPQAPAPVPDGVPDALPPDTGGAPEASTPLAPPEPDPAPINDRAPIKLGILHSLSGLMASSETSLKDVALMTIDLINRHGGVLGRPLQPVVVDPASNWPLFAQKAR